MSMKIRQTSPVKGISIFEKEIKISQFAEDTRHPAVFRPLFGGKKDNKIQIAVDFSVISRLLFNLEKT